MGPMCWSPDFRQQSLGGSHNVGQLWIRGRHIIHQNMPSWLRRPHTVSKGLGRPWRWYVCGQKPTFGCLNLQGLCSYHSLCFFLPLCHRVRSTPSFKSFFALKTFFAIAEIFENLHTVPFCAELQVIIWRQAISTATGMRSSPLLLLYHHLDCCLADFVHLATHSPQQRWWWARKNSPRLIAPLCTHI